MDPQIQNLIPYIGVAAFVSIAVFIDVRSRRIPNWLTVSAFVLGLLFNIAVGGLPGLWLSLGGFAVGFGTLLILWLIGGGGGGDVKLMGAVGSWVGAVPTLMIFLGSALFAVVCTVGMMSWQHVGGSKNEKEIATEIGSSGPSNNNSLKKYIPYAVPVAMATWAMLVMQLIKASAA